MKRLLLACAMLGGLTLQAQATPVAFTFNGTTTSNQPVSASFGYDTDGCSLNALNDAQYCTITDAGSAAATVNFLANTYNYPNAPGGTNEYVVTPSGSWLFTIGDPAEANDSVEHRLAALNQLFRDMEDGIAGSNTCLANLAELEQQAIDNGTPMSTAEIDAATQQCQSLKLTSDQIIQRMEQSWQIDGFDWPAFGTAVIPGADYKFLWFNVDGVTQIALEPAPEPTSMALVVAGLLGIAALRRRARSQPETP